MGRVVYLMNVSLDGYVADRAGSLEWTAMDEELHQWFNDDMRRYDAILYGRGLYETMTPYWPNVPSDPTSVGVELEFAQLWLERPKIVFSSTLESVDWNSRLVRGDVAEALPKLREEFPGDISVAGPTLAAGLIAKGLVDEFKLMIHPVILGGGKRYWPEHDRPLDLELVEERRIGSRFLLLDYRRH
jgi:dihydrofolate reductase